MSNLLKKIIDPMANMIRVADDRMFLIFMRICRISLFFLDCPPRILGGFSWRLQKEPAISNSKIGVYRAIDEIYPSTYVKTAGQ